MTETIDTANLRALAENIIAADGPIWWIEQDFRAVKEALDATIDDARFVAAANPTTIIALLDRLAAAEARNATLTDDAARLDFLCHEPARMIECEPKGQWWRVYEDVAQAEAPHASWRAIVTKHERTPREAIDAAIQARAAASISTKEGDTHADR